jgi:hypothetical protein
MQSLLHTIPHILQASAVVVGIGMALLASQVIRVLVSVPRPKPIYVPIHDLLGERR